MESLYALTAASLFTIGIYLLLSRHLLKMIFGLMILSNAVNLSIFTVGRLSATRPPFIAPNVEHALEPMSNALPQALLLTAIVISFGLMAFSLGILLRAYRDLGGLNTELMRDAEDHNRQAPKLHDGTLLEDHS